MNTLLYEERNRTLADFFAGSTILISGATGLIGSRCVRMLLELNKQYDAGIRILGLYKDEKKKDALFADVTGGQDVLFLRHEVTEELCYDGTVDYVIHCAQVSGGTKLHLSNPMKVFEIAYQGTKNLLDFSLSHSVKGFCFVSTYEIYGAINQEALIEEAAPCNLNPMVLRNCYAECKRMCEAMCVAAASKSQMKVFAGRLTSTFGEGVKYDDPRFFAEFARCIHKGQDIVLKSMGGTVRSYLDADDAAAAFLYILAKGKSGEAYNITNMENVVSIRDIALRMIALCNAPVQLKFDVSEDVAALGYRAESTTLMDASKLEDLGWKPVYSLEDTLEKLLQCIAKEA